MASFPGSYMPTSGGTAARNRDQLDAPFNARPQAMTVYVRFVESGTFKITDARILQIGKSDDTTPSLILLEFSGKYRFQHFTTISNVAADLGAAPALGDLVELLGQLKADGSLVLQQSLNGAAATEASTATTLTFAQTWSDTRLWLNSIGTSNVGFARFRNVRVARGVNTMDQMRRIANTA